MSLFIVVPGTMYKIGALLMLILLLFALKNRQKHLAVFIAGVVLVIHHWLLNAIASNKCLDSDNFTAFIVNGGFIYAPLLPNPFAAIPLSATLCYQLFNYNDGTFSMLIPPKIFGTLLIATAVSAGVWLFQNLSKERDSLYKASITDSLTGLYTYTYAVSIGQELLAQGNKVVVVLMDLDDFKAINDTFGHIVGNLILKQFAISLQNVLPEDAIIARMGGDEFVIIVKDENNPTTSLSFIELLKEQEYIVDPDLGAITVAFSYGVAIQRNTILTSIQDLVNLADQNMYCNKASRGISINISSIEAKAPRKYQDIINVLAQKDVYTYVHSLHVARYGAILAENVGMKADAVANIFLAGWLHDLGKIAIPNEILRKPDKLADTEYHLIKKHVSFGTNLLTAFDINDSVLKAIANHHERCDGRGYPNGYLNHEIPIEGRILAIADAFSAMTVKRVYCNRLSEMEAIQELKREKGLQFDPELVEKFIDIIEGGSQNEKLMYN